MRCNHCNKEFIPKRKTAKYCSDSCRKLSHKNKVNNGDAKNTKHRNNNASEVTRSYYKRGDANSNNPLVEDLGLSCINCSRPLLRNRKKYCNRDCQKQFTDRNRLNNYYRSGFLKWWLNSFKRSWCLGILHNPNGTKQTSKDLIALYEAYKTRNNANGCGKAKLEKFNLCHLDPVKGNQGRYGLLHWSNLLVAPTTLNKQLGNKEFQFNLSAVAVANMMRKGSFRDVELIHILNHYLDGALLEMINSKPHMVARKSSLKPPDRPPLDVENVLWKEMDRLNIDGYKAGFYDCFPTMINPHQAYKTILTNSL